jgi:hypothetical protein
MIKPDYPRQLYVTLWCLLAWTLFMAVVEVWLAIHQRGVQHWVMAVYQTIFCVVACVALRYLYRARAAAKHQ